MKVNKCIMAVILITFYIVSCSGLPDNIRNFPFENVKLNEVQVNPKAYIGKKVLWGGVIIADKTEDNRTTVEVLEYPLKKNGVPRLNRASGGRFIVIINSPLESISYLTQRLFTVAGTLESEGSSSNIAQSIRIPIISADDYYVWPKSNFPYYRSPYYGTQVGYRFYGHLLFSYHAGHHFAHHSTHQVHHSSQQGHHSNH